MGCGEASRGGGGIALSDPARRPMMAAPPAGVSPVRTSRDLRGHLIHRVEPSMHELPIPPHFAPARVGEVWRVPYQERAAEAAAWAWAHGVRPAAEDRLRICLVAVDVQNTFCIPGFELFVGGRSGTRGGRRQPAPVRVPLPQPRHDHAGDPDPGHPSGDADLSPALAGERARRASRRRSPWSPSRTSSGGCGGSTPPWRRAWAWSRSDAQRQLRHYARELAEGGKYALTVWPYHAMLGGIGHALVSAVEEAVFFHAHRPREPARLPGQGRQPAHRALLGDRARGDLGAGRRADRARATASWWTTCTSTTR